MKPTTMVKILTLLGDMAHHAEPWDSRRELYVEVLLPLPDETADRLKNAILAYGRFRPSAAEVAQMAARLLGTAPDPEMVAFQLLTKARRIGRLGRRDPANPHVCLPGAPPLSAIEEATVEQWGGWQRFCERTFESDLQMEQQVVRTVRRVAEMPRQIGSQPLLGGRR